MKKIFSKAGVSLQNRVNVLSIRLARPLFAVLIAAFSATTYAQSGTNSPYSQYGLGELTDQAVGFNHGMNGLGLGFREHNQVNFLNPASYSALDSLTFILDAGASGQITNFKEGNKKVNANNADFEYVVAGLRLAKHVGLSLGLVPYSNIGYNYSTSNYVDDTKSVIYTNTYSGSGGIHEAYLGMGWEPFKGFSFGFNAGYLWGDYTKSFVNAYSETQAKTLSKYYNADVRSYKVDFGMQLTAKLSKKDWLTLGLTYGMGHKIGGDPTCLVISNNSQTGVADTASYPAAGKLELEIPTTFGAGITLNHNNKWKLGADYMLQKWSQVEYPEYEEQSGQPIYHLKEGLFKDRQRITVGGDFCPKEDGKHFFSRIHYRAGFSYATPYLIVNGGDGPKEMSASVGLGIPIINAWNNRSQLNISAQWVKQSAKNLITENTFRITIGLTFNERWFDKWKVE